MVKRTRPIQVRLPDGRTFILRYKKSMYVEVTPNIELNKSYKQRPASRNKHQQCLAAQQQGRGLGSILKFEKKKKLEKVHW